MGGLCGGAHEISGIKAPLFLHGGWLEGSWGGWVVVGWVMGWMGGYWWGGWGMESWVGGVVVLSVPMTHPIMEGVSDAPMLVFDNLVKKLDNLAL